MTDLVVAIVGTGVGGTEMAGYLGLHGTRVRVHDIRKEAVAGIRDRGGLEVSGIASGFSRVERATTDLAEAVDALDARYVTEDVPYGLVPIAELGRLAGVPTPVAHALTVLASAALGREFAEDGRTLARMGLEGRSLTSIQGDL